MNRSTELKSVAPLPPVHGQGLSKILPHEEAEAKALIAEELNALGCIDPPAVTGWWVLVKTYIRPEMIKEIERDDGSKAQLYITPAAQAEDRFTSIAALVIGVGPDAYKDAVRFPAGPWCKVGDWVIVPRNEGFPIVYDGIAMQFIPDDKIVAVITDPAKTANTVAKAKL